ncbi:hypothetical protein OAU22_01720, partial [Flavobacteriaceae bacterium]|nr:hypothetical protein [Flavobacteriaceae bacterium]
MNTLTETNFNFPNQLSKYSGKVREVYKFKNDVLVMISTDRLSAFDVVLPKGIPYKGQILNQIACKMLDATSHIVPNCSIISSDSRQFYKEMNIGTAVPSKIELSKVKHYCVQHKSVINNYTINDFQIEALDIIKHELKINDHIIMVGGSGMYMDAVTHGMDTFPNISSEISKTVNSNYKLLGIKYLHDKLRELDPEYLLTVDINNHRRLIRALEVSLCSNKP